MEPQLAPEPDMSHALTDDRRAWIRYRTDVETFCHAVTGRKEADVWWQGQVRDLSRGGVGLMLDRWFPLGTLLMIELPSRGTSSVYLVLAKVVRAVEQADGRWEIGCVLVTGPNNDDFEALTGDRPAEGTDLP